MEAGGINMKEIVLYIATSIDGYIAREDGSIDWLNEFEDSDYDFYKFYSTVDVCVLGRTTYEQIVHVLSPDIWPYQDKETFVLSSTNIEDENVQSLTVDELIKVMENMSGRVWIVGGSSTLRFFLENNWVDKMILTTIPILLGKGISLFKEIDDVQRFEIESVGRYNNMTEVTYNRRK